MKTVPSSSITERPPHEMIKHGILEIPSNARSIVIFVHGPGKSCLSPRNRLVARSLLHKGFAVLLPDLSDRDEEFFETDVPQDPEYVSRISGRLTAIIDWVAANHRTRELHIGLFGARTGAAAAMIATAKRPELVRAVVSRSGRPDLAADLLAKVLAPTLMIVGGKDSTHIDHNRRACGQMQDRPLLELIQGAGHFFSEPGMIEKVASISCLWFHRNLAMCG